MQPETLLWTGASALAISTVLWLLSYARRTSRARVSLSSMRRRPRLRVMSMFLYFAGLGITFLGLSSLEPETIQSIAVRMIIIGVAALIGGTYLVTHLPWKVDLLVKKMFGWVLIALSIPDILYFGWYVTQR